MYLEQLVQQKIEKGSEVVGENPPQCHFVNHKFRLISPGIQPVTSWWKFGD
jgi:hypothetical protein